jgi:AraC-like DNA-binding protein
LQSQRTTSFTKHHVLAALPNVVYWFGWYDRNAPLEISDFGRRMQRLAASALALSLPRPAIGVSFPITDWADLRRAMTRTTVGFRLAAMNGQPFVTPDETDRFLDGPRQASRGTTALVNAVAGGDVELVRREADRVAESFLAAYVSPIAMLRTRFVAVMLQCGEASRAAGQTEHVVTRWVDHRVREFWEVYSYPLMAALFVDGLVELARLTAEAMSGNLPRAVAAAKSLLTATAGENYPVSYLAREAGVSVGQLSRLFKRALGCSIPEFRNRLRIDRAAELLRSSDKAITTIALECGFTNLTHFHRVFVRSRGRSPSVFRRDSLKTGG